MRSVIVCALLVLALAASASANLVTNGGFETGTLAGWTKWGPIGWGSNCDTVTQSSASVADGTWRARLQISNGEGSFGIYQVVAVPANVLCNFETWVRATSNSVNWAEVLLFNYAATPGDIDSGAISKPFCVWKRDSWTGYAGVPGGTLPTVATPGGPGDSWEKVTGAATSSTGFMTIAYKWGRSGGGFSGSMYVDANKLTAVPEPSSLLALMTGAIGLAGLAFRRR